MPSDTWEIHLVSKAQCRREQCAEFEHVLELCHGTQCDQAGSDSAKQKGKIKIRTYNRRTEVVVVADATIMRTQYGSPLSSRACFSADEMPIHFLCSIEDMMALCCLACCSSSVGTADGGEKSMYACPLCDMTKTYWRKVQRAGASTSSLAFFFT